jgi:hypothetical protein
MEDILEKKNILYGGHNMAVLSRVKMQKARRKQASFSENNKVQVKEKPISPEEHQKKMELLKSLGLIKEETENEGP